MSDTQQPSAEKKERRLEKQIEVAASPAEVWKALTDPAELARWFPLGARHSGRAGENLFIVGTGL